MGIKRIIAIDFDGVIHDYNEGWKGYDVVYGKPVKGIKILINQLKERFNIVIYSSRCNKEEGRQAIKIFCDKNKVYYDDISYSKPPAFVTIDDRCICFNGNTEGLYNQIINFKPWNKK